MHIHGTCTYIYINIIHMYAQDESPNSATLITRKIKLRRSIILRIAGAKKKKN